MGLRYFNFIFWFISLLVYHFCPIAAQFLQARQELIFSCPPDSYLSKVPGKLTKLSLTTFHIKECLKRPLWFVIQSKGEDLLETRLCTDEWEHKLHTGTKRDPAGFKNTWLCNSCLLRLIWAHGTSCLSVAEIKALIIFQLPFNNNKISRTEEKPFPFQYQSWLVLF